MKEQKGTKRWVLGVGIVFLAIVFTVLLTKNIPLLSILQKWQSSSLSSSTTVKAPPKLPSPPAAVAAIGTLEPKGEVITLSAPAFAEGTKVERLLVAVGDRVQIGQVVAILDNQPRLQAALEKSRSQEKIAAAKLEQVLAGAKQGNIEAQKKVISRLKSELAGQKASQKATIRRIEAELSNARTECNRFRLLYEDGAVSESEKENKCLLPQTLQNELEEAIANRSRTEETITTQITEAKATLDSIEEIRPVDVAVSKAELADAQAQVSKAKADLAQAYVRSPQSGQVLKINTRPGEIVKDGIVEIGETGEMYVRAEVYEGDIGRIRPGQRATITSDGFPEKLQGQVEELELQVGKKNVLGTDPVADTDARVVEVKIRLNPEDSAKVSGLTNLKVDVIIDLKKIGD